MDTRILSIGTGVCLF